MGTLGATALAGCGITPSQGPSTSAQPATPSPSPLAGATEAEAECVALEALVRRATSLAAASPLSAADVANLAWLGTSIAVQRGALVKRSPSPSASTVASPEPPFATGAEALAAVTQLLTDHAASSSARAKGTTGAVAVLWASLAAFRAAAGPALTPRVFQPGPTATPSTSPNSKVKPTPLSPPAFSLEATHADGPSAPPAPNVEPDATLLARVYEILYGYQVTLATPSLNADNRAPLLERYEAWLRLRDTLTTRLHGPGATPMVSIPQASPAYRIGVPATFEAALKQAAGLEAAAVPKLAASLLAQTTPDEVAAAVDTFVGAHAAAVRWGSPQLVWPGAT
mgnify:FL=1